MSDAAGRRAAFSYERIRDLATTEGYHYRVSDAADNRIATCYVEENARFIVDRLNSVDTALAEATRAERAMLKRIADAKDSMEWWADLDRMLNAAPTGEEKNG